MKKGHTAMPTPLIVLSASLLLLSSLAWCADDPSDVDKRLDASAKVLNEIMGVPDKAIPDKIMHDAKCIAVIPSMVRIAVGFGGSHGKASRPAARRAAPGALPHPSR